jgi:antitoxin YefM
METVRISVARANLKQHMDDVCASGEPLVITRPSGEPVVLISLATYNSMKETEHLMKSPANAERLTKSIEQHKSGNVMSIELPVGSLAAPVASH